MNRIKAARELVGIARGITGGLRVNTRFVKFDGETSVSQMRRELEDVARELKNWEHLDVKMVQGFGSEWIPLW